VYQRKTKDVYELQGNYGYGWDYILEEDDRKVAREQLRCYDQNERGVPHRLVKKRVRLEVANDNS